MKKVLIVILITTIISTAFIINTNDENILSTNNVKMCISTEEGERVQSYSVNCTKNLIKYINDSELRIEITNYKSKLHSNNNNFDYAAGMYFPEDNEIIILNKKDKREMTKIMWHEIGHVIDYKKFDLSQQKEFLEIYNKENKMFCPEIFGITNPNEYQIFFYDYFKSNPKEYFAECFSMYIVESAILKQYAPMTYEYIKNLINNI